VEGLTDSPSGGTGGETPAPVLRFKRLFERLDPEVPMPLEEVYAPAVRFEDPLHRVEGIEALRTYFNRLNARILSAEFVFGEEVVAQGGAALSWTMTVRLRRPRQTVVVEGLSLLRFEERITWQRDYFDVGGMVYERLPLLGGLLRTLRKAL
jgi:limonene-1,2-epoxide hydrolase